MKHLKKSKEPTRSRETQTILTSLTRIQSSISYSMDTDILIGKVTKKLDISELEKYITRKGGETKVTKPLLSIGNLVENRILSKHKSNKDYTNIYNNDNDHTKCNKSKTNTGIKHKEINMYRRGRKSSDISSLSDDSLSSINIPHKEIHYTKYDKLGQIFHTNIHKNKHKKYQNNDKQNNEIKKHAHERYDKHKNYTKDVDFHVDSGKVSYGSHVNERIFRTEDDLLVLIKTEYEKMKCYDTLLKNKQRLQKLELAQELNDNKLYFQRKNDNATHNLYSRKLNKNKQCYTDSTRITNTPKYYSNCNGKNQKYSKYSEWIETNRSDNTNIIRNNCVDDNHNNRSFDNVNSENNDTEFDTSFVIETLDKANHEIIGNRHAVNQPFVRSVMETKTMANSRRKNENIAVKYDITDLDLDIVNKINELVI